MPAQGCRRAPSAWPEGRRRRSAGPRPEAASARPPSPLVHLPAAVDVEGGAGDVLGPVGGKERHHLAEVTRCLKTMQRDPVAEVVPALLFGLALHGRELLDDAGVQSGLDN